MFERVRKDRSPPDADRRRVVAPARPARLVVGPARGAVEVEADRLAAEALAIGQRRVDGPVGVPADGRVRRSAFPHAPSAIGPAGGELDGVTAGRIRRASGSPMDAGTRAEMEGAFGADLSAVRIHAGSEAADLSRSLGARAFTTGSDIFFGSDEYRPRTGAGRRLLAHELAHTLQESGPAQRASRMIRRTPYLANSDGSIYKDTTNDDLELAYLGNVAGVKHMFVEYKAIAKIQDQVKGLLPSVGPIRTDFSTRQRDKKSRAKNEQRKRATGLDLGDEGPAINTKVREEVRRAATKKRHDDDVLGNRLLIGLGRVYAWLNGDDWADVTDDLTPVKLATVVMRIVEAGAQWLPTGGGSRLPAPSGKLYVAPPRMRARVFELLGVRSDQLAAYEGVQLTTMEDADEYITTRDNLVASGANVYTFENVDTGTWMFYASEVVNKRSDNSRVQVAGHVYGDDDFAGLDDTRDAVLMRAITASYGQLTAATADSGWVPGTEMTASRDRGDGQALAMKNWNALGAAAYANRFMGRALNLKQNWEWLHVRGAQIGGETVGGNLVPGLYATNSCMIPFEAMIKNWSLAGPKTFWAKFVATGVNGPFATGIELWITAKGHEQLGDLAPTRLATFDPLAGRVVDKLAGEMIKRSIDRSVRV
jgi:hypothetical protein